jgi:hypothetical protein
LFADADIIGLVPKELQYTMTEEMGSDPNGTVDGVKGLQGVGGAGVAPWET